MIESPMTYEEFCRSTNAKLVYNPINYAYFWYGDNVFCFAHESPSIRHNIPEERWVHYQTYTLREFADEVAKRGLKGVNLAGWNHGQD